MHWYYLVIICSMIVLGYANFTGWRIFAPTNAQQWSASGPGGHK